MNVDVTALLGGFRENMWVLELAEIQLARGDRPGALAVAVLLKQHIEASGEAKSVVMPAQDGPPYFKDSLR